MAATFGKGLAKMNIKLRTCFRMMPLAYQIIIFWVKPFRKSDTIILSGKKKRQKFAYNCNSYGSIDGKSFGNLSEILESKMT